MVSQGVSVFTNRFKPPKNCNKALLTTSTAPYKRRSKSPQIIVCYSQQQTAIKMFKALVSANKNNNNTVCWLFSLICAVCIRRCLGHFGCLRGCRAWPQGRPSRRPSAKTKPTILLLWILRICCPCCLLRLMMMISACVLLVLSFSCNWLTVFYDEIKWTAVKEKKCVIFLYFFASTSC